MQGNGNKASTICKALDKYKNKLMKKPIVNKKKRNCKVTSNSLFLKSFTKYCKEHPDERGFQALKNWLELEMDVKEEVITSIQIVTSKW